MSLFQVLDESKVEKYIHDYETIQNSCGFFELQNWGILEITGSDRKTFLHGMLTNDVNSLTENEGSYNLFLTAQGKIRADLWLFNLDDKIYLTTHDYLKQELYEGLDKYLIMEDVEIHDCSDQWIVFSVYGPQSLDLLSKSLPGISLPENDNSILEMQIESISFLVAKTAHFGSFGYDFLVPSDNAEQIRTLFTSSDIQQIPIEVSEILRIESGVPRCKQDIDERVLPQEASLDRALNFQKGCYLGQEVVARLHFRGHINREWTGFKLEFDSLPVCPMTIYFQEKEVGKITSICFSPRYNQYIGIGFLRCEVKNEHSQLSTELNGNRITMKISRFPFC
jgi:folate-binding protein YgfZ